MEKLSVIPFQEIGFLKFGMDKKDLLEVLNEPYEIKNYDFLKDLDLEDDDLIHDEELIFDSINIKISFDSNKKLNWIGIYPESKYLPILNNLDLLKLNKKAIYDLFRTNEILEDEDNMISIIDLGITICFSEDDLIEEIGFMNRDSVSLYR